MIQNEFKKNVCTEPQVCSI